MKNFFPQRSSVLLLILFAVMMSRDVCFAQLSQVVSGGSIYSPPSPNASALLRYANVPVDEHTGIPSVVLPIDQLSGRQLSVPITLSYHAAGNKVQDVASNVGLGFVLNAGGVVTRVMRGLPDESAQGYQYNGKKVYSSNDLDSVYLNKVINNKVDGEPDMFYFNFLGHTGKMVVDTLGNAQYLPDQGIRVIRHPIHNNPDSTNNPWVLRDFSGTTYVFGSDTSSKEVTVVNLAGQPITKAITYVSSWYLAQVITPDGKETMNFNYNSGPDMSYEQYRNVITYLIQNNCTDTRTGIFSSKVTHKDVTAAIDTATVNVSTVIQVLSPKYLSSIQNDMGSVTFSYGSRLDLSGGLALSQVKVFNIDDSATPLKTYTFNESYFSSPNPNSPTDPDSKRLRLDCVTLQGRSAETKQLFVFTYNEQTQLPPRNSNNVDHWGYYTTLDNRGGSPPVTLTTDKYGNYVEAFDQRGPDSVRIQANILTKVRNVNGGYTNFIYEMDTYKSDGQISMGGGLRIKTIIENDSLGQVVPVITQYTYTLNDGTSSGEVYNAVPYYVQGITNYQAGTVVTPIPSLLSYEVGNLKKPLTDIGIAVDVAFTIAGISSPIGLAVDVGITILAPAVADAWDFLFHRTHKYSYNSPPFALSSTPLNNLFDINGASVTYSQVEVHKADGSKLVDYYTSQQDYPDSTSTAQLNCLAKPVKAIYGNTGSYAPSTSFDFERGLLKKSMAYDNNNNLVSMVTNTYQLSNKAASVWGQMPSVSGYATLTDNTFQVITYNVGIYQNIAQNIQLVQSNTQLFDQTNNGNSINSSKSYIWEPGYPTLVNITTEQRSDGKTLVNFTTYPTQYPLGTPFIDDMVKHYMWGVPIEKVSALQDGSGNISITGGVVTKYKAGGFGLLDTAFSLSAANPIPSSAFKFSNQLTGQTGSNYQPYGPDPRYIGKAFYQLYDSKNNLIQSQNIGEPSSSIIWGYNQDVPIAQISNATVNQVAYTSFETNDQQYWLFTPGGRDSSGLAKTGKIRYQLSSGTVKTKAIIPAGTYILSLWTQGTKPTISGTTADVSIVNGESDNNTWNFYMDRVTVAGGTQITLTGSGFIDELRLYPQGAHISTVTVSPQVGTSSVSSQDDKVNTYEYDALVRMATERDDQYNVLKQYAYSNVPQVPCIDTPAVWKGINPICYTGQNDSIPDTVNYSALAANSYGNAICSFTRTPGESSYVAQVNFTVSYSDNTTYSNSVIIKGGDLSTVLGLPLTGKSAESIAGIAIDTVINLSNDYGQTFQKYQNRQRLRDGYTEANTLTGGLGPYIAPIQSAAGCSPLFSNQPQSVFYKNDCTNGSGSYVPYTVPAATYTGTSQFSADSTARAAGQAYANAHGNCTAADTTWVGITPHCVTGTADSGTPTLSAYGIVKNNPAQVYLLMATITRSSAEAAHDATVSYTMTFIDGSSVTYTTPMYKNQLNITISPPLGGYGPGSVTGISITHVVYSALNRLVYANRARVINGVADGYQEANTPGTYYLAPIEDPGACGTWFYNTAQSGFYKNNCTTAGTGLPVTYTVAAHTDSSMVSQSYADALARIRGQSYANATASCDTGAYVTTYAGNGTMGYVEGPLLSAEFNHLVNITMDNNGNIYGTDFGRFPNGSGGSFQAAYVRKISAGGIVSTMAGYPYLSGGPFSSENLIGIATDVLGNIYVCDQTSARIVKITATGVISFLAGGHPGNTDGQGAAAGFSDLFGMCIDTYGNLYVGDAYRIRKITPGGLVSTVAGNGTQGYADGSAGTAEFYLPQAITIDKSGTLYVSDNGRIRKISGGMVSSIAGNGTLGYKEGTGTDAQVGLITQMATDAAGNMYAAESYAVLKITPTGVVTGFIPPIVNPGYRNGPLSTAAFMALVNLTFDAAGNLYLFDQYNYVIRKITFPQ